MVVASIEGLQSYAQSKQEAGVTYSSSLEERVHAFHQPEQQKQEQRGANAEGMRDNTKSRVKERRRTEGDRHEVANSAESWSAEER
jgi:hypothetical protein